MMNSYWNAGDSSDAISNSSNRKAQANLSRVEGGSQQGTHNASVTGSATEGRSSRVSSSSSALEADMDKPSASGSFSGIDDSVVMPQSAIKRDLQGSESDQALQPPAAVWTPSAGDLAVMSTEVNSVALESPGAVDAGIISSSIDSSSFGDLSSSTASSFTGSSSKTDSSDLALDRSETEPLLSSASAPSSSISGGPSAAVDASSTTTAGHGWPTSLPEIPEQPEQESEAQDEAAVNGSDVAGSTDTRDNLADTEYARLPDTEVDSEKPSTSIASSKGKEERPVMPFAESSQAKKSTESSSASALNQPGSDVPSDVPVKAQDVAAREKEKIEQAMPLVDTDSASIEAEYSAPSSETAQSNAAKRSLVQNQTMGSDEQAAVEALEMPSDNSDQQEEQQSYEEKEQDIEQEQSSSADTESKNSKQQYGGGAQHGQQQFKQSGGSGEAARSVGSGLESAAEVGKQAVSNIKSSGQELASNLKSSGKRAVSSAQSAGEQIVDSASEAVNKVEELAPNGLPVLVRAAAITVGALLLLRSMFYRPLWYTSLLGTAILAVWWQFPWVVDQIKLHLGEATHFFRVLLDRSLPIWRQVVGLFQQTISWFRSTGWGKTIIRMTRTVLLIARNLSLRWARRLDDRWGSMYPNARQLMISSVRASYLYSKSLWVRLRDWYRYPNGIPVSASTLDAKQLSAASTNSQELSEVEFDQQQQQSLPTSRAAYASYLLPAYLASIFATLSFLSPDGPLFLAHLWWPLRWAVIAAFTFYVHISQDQVRAHKFPIQDSADEGFLSSWRGSDDRRTVDESTA